MTVSSGLAVCPPLSKTTEDCVRGVEIYPVHMYYGSEPHLFACVCMHVHVHGISYMPSCQGSSHKQQ